MIEWAEQKASTESQIADAREAGDQDMLRALAAWMDEMLADVHHCELCGVEYLFEPEDLEDEDVDLTYSACCNEPFHPGLFDDTCEHYADRCGNHAA